MPAQSLEQLKQAKALFDLPPSRMGSNSIKWDRTLKDNKNLIPLSIADMDFPAPKAVTDAILKRAEHGIYGYSFRTQSYIESIINWLASVHDWKVSKEQLQFYPSGTVAAINMLVKAFTKESDEIIVQTPNYPRLIDAVVTNGRKLINNKLILKGNNYFIDFDDLRAQITSKTKMLLLCSPHNPSGRVWTIKELTELAQICKQHNILVVSDEVHADLLFNGVTHTHFNALPNEVKPKSVTIISSCKSFNLAGFPQSTLISDDKNIQVIIQKNIDDAQINLDGLFSAVATEAAYNNGLQWRNLLMEYVLDNRNFLANFLKKEIPQIKLVSAHATYLAWLDFSGLNLSHQAINKILIEKAQVVLYDGKNFGSQCDGFFRLNLACSQKLIKQALLQIKKAFGDI